MRRMLWIGALVLSLFGAATTLGWPSASADVLPTSPRRVLDTRDGTGAAQRPLRPGSVLKVQIPGVSGSDPSVLLNLTGTRASGRGFVKAWSCDDPAPETSVLNVDPGRAVANSIALPYSSGGLCFSSSVVVDLIADVTGTATGGDLHTGPSARLYDSRDGAAHEAGKTYRIEVAGRGGIDQGAALALLNVTVAQPAGDGWALVTACNKASDASTLNFRAGEAVPHFTASALGGGDICITASADTHVIVDSFGWAPGSSDIQALVPGRVADTRSGIGGTVGPLRDGDVLRFRVAGYDGVPNDAAGAIVNIVAVRGASTGYVSLDPCDGAGSSTSTINLWPGVLRANQSVLSLHPSGDLCARVTLDDERTSIHLVVDAVGFIEGNVSRPTPPSTTVPPPTTVPPNPSPGGRFATLPVGASLPSGAECAARVRSAGEIRPANATQNSTRGFANGYRTNEWSGFARVDGDFTGTTDEIIQWAACKWGIDEDIVRAQIVKESGWFMAAVGDGGDSFGLGQVRRPYHGDRAANVGGNGTGAFEADNAIRSSAYNLDYTYASWRACYEGVYTWLNNQERNGTYGAGDVWGCLGVWFSGRWYVNTDAYLASVRDNLETRIWETSGFAAWKPPS